MAIDGLGGLSGIGGFSGMQGIPGMPNTGAAQGSGGMNSMAGFENILSSSGINGMAGGAGGYEVKFPDFERVSGPTVPTAGSMPVSGSFDGKGMEKALSSAISAVDEPQQDLNSKIIKFVEGKEEIHNVMIAAEKARFAVNFTVKVRDKIIDAYNTVMRMQM